MHNNKVSIIIPVYNTEKYLDACIRSVLKPTYTNWELLLINDGSTDNSENICLSYANFDDRIKVISQANNGVSAARNVGMEQANGKYITFLDSDDEFEDDAVEVLLSDIIQTDADIVSAGKSTINRTGEVKSLYDDGKIYSFNGDEMIKRSLMYDGQTRSLHAKIFSRDFLKDIRFVKGHNINEDGYFLFQCYTKTTKVVHHNISLYKYYHRENSSSRGVFSEKYFDMLYFCELKMNYICKEKPHLIELAKDMEARTNILFLDVLCRNYNSKYKNIAKKSISIIRKRYIKFNPTNKHEKKMATIITFGLYSLYRFLFRIRYQKKFSG